MKVFKKCLAALLVGGMLGILGELLFTLIGFIPGLEPSFVVYVTLISMGVVAFIAFPLGFYQKLLAAGGFGAMLQFSGFVAAMADTYDSTQRSTRSSLKAVLACIKLFLIVFGLGTVFALLITAVVFYLIQGGSPVALVAPAPFDNVVFAFLGAFVVCGVLSALFQLFMMLSKLSPPIILLMGFALGSLLVPLGAIDWLQAVGSAGAFVTVMGAGGGAGSSFLALYTGSIMPLLEILTVFVALAVIGILAGLITNKKNSGKVSKDA